MTLNFQQLDGEAKDLMEKLRANITLLSEGWREKIEYVMPVKYHVAECNYAVRQRQKNLCDCPTKQEKRSRHVKVQGLLDQLQEYTKSKDVDRNPKAARGAPRVKTPKMHPELNGFFALDEITCDAYATLDRIYEAAGRDRADLLSRPIREVLGGLTYQMNIIVISQPDLVRDVVKATGKWVNQARGTLNMNVAEAQFGSTVCGNCGGGLAIAWDNGSDVRCVGTPTAPPCGETYPMSEWVSLYEKGRK